MITYPANERNLTPIINLRYNAIIIPANIEYNSITGQEIHCPVVVSDVRRAVPTRSFGIRQPSGEELPGFSVA